MTDIGTLIDGSSDQEIDLRAQEIELIEERIVSRPNLEDFGLVEFAVELDLTKDLDLRLTDSQQWRKRAFDIVTSVVALLLLAPVFVLVALAVVVTTGGPVLYRGNRVGKGGHEFKMLKFRSMVEDAEQKLQGDPELHSQYVSNGYKLSEADDPRLTSLGRLLRMTSIDELPQFWNVLRGDMSIVGCRPVVPEELDEYGVLAPIYTESKPGITGHWQVFGRGTVPFPERALLDLRNLQDWSLRGEVKIVLKTVLAVFSCRGAY